MNLMVRIFKHVKLVTKHRWYVFIYAVKAGIPWRGLIHDLSKFSPVEFCESVKYYNGTRSPLHACRDDIGYSRAWLHHKGRNKHHFEYWEDISKTERVGVFLPYKYMVEALCDKLSAGKVYNGKKWNQKEPIKYWINVESKAPVAKHPGSVEFMNTALQKVADEGLNAALKRKYLKKVYNDIAKKYGIK